MKNIGEAFSVRHIGKYVLNIYFFITISFAITSNSTGKEVFSLLRLDKNISTILTHPTQNDSRKILHYIQTFWENYLALDKHVLENNHSVLKSAYCLLNQSIPRFIRLNIDVAVLARIFQWTEDDVKIFSQSFSNITRLSAMFPEHFLLMVAHLNKRFEDFSYDSDLIVDSDY